MNLSYEVQHVNLTIEEGPEALETAKNFYVDILGLEILPRPENIDEGRPGWWLRLGSTGQQIHISAEPRAKDYNGSSRRHSAFQVNDIKKLEEQLQTHGVNVEGTQQLSGQIRFFCRDPFGNLLEFLQYVKNG